MKKNTLLVLILFLGYNVYSQFYFTKTGTIKFDSHTDLEDIKAENRKVVSILNSNTGALEFSLLMKSFDFPNNLMEQHFNESFAQSSKYPKASFKGVISNVSTVNFIKDGTYKVIYIGKLTIKDVTRDISGTATINVKGGILNSTSQLKIKPKDYNMSIPSTVAGKIAEEINVDINLDYKLK